MGGLGTGWLVMLAVFAGAIPLTLVFFGLRMLLRTRRFLRGTRKVAGRVVTVGRGYSRNRGGGGGWVYRPTFAYEGPGGTVLTSTADASSTWNFPPGSEVEILVNPADPGRAMVAGGFQNLGAVVLIAMGLVFLAAGVAAALAIHAQIAPAAVVEG